MEYRFMTNKAARQLPQHQRAQGAQAGLRGRVALLTTMALVVSTACCCGLADVFEEENSAKG